MSSACCCLVCRLGCGVVAIVVADPGGGGARAGGGLEAVRHLLDPVLGSRRTTASVRQAGVAARVIGVASVVAVVDEQRRRSRRSGSGSRLRSR